MKKLLSVIVVSIVLSSVLCICAFAEEQERKLKIGDLITELPDCTYNEYVNITDDTGIEFGEFSIAWKEFDGAASYSVKVFFNINYMNSKAALNFIYEDEIKTETNSAMISGLQTQRRYTVVVYALDAEGNEIAVYDSLHAFTYPKAEIEDIIEDDSGKGLSDTYILIIAAGVVGLLVLVAVIVLIIVLKKPKN